MTNWTHLPPEDLENFIRHAKANGYINSNNAIQVDFDDFCALVRKLQEQAAQIKQLTKTSN